MRRSNATKEHPAPASQTRPKLTTTRPEPAVERAIDFDRQIDTLRIANEYDALRIAVELRKAEWEEELNSVEARLIEAMKASGEKNLTTLHGRVSLLSKTEDKNVEDEDAALKLLAAKNIPLPPSLREYLARHDLAMPMKSKPGLPDRIRFDRNK